MSGPHPPHRRGVVATSRVRLWVPSVHWKQAVLLHFLSWPRLNHSPGCQPGASKEGLEIAFLRGPAFDHCQGLHFPSSHTSSCCTLYLIFLVRPLEAKDRRNAAKGTHGWTKGPSGF